MSLQLLVYDQQYALKPKYDFQHYPKSQLLLLDLQTNLKLQTEKTLIGYFPIVFQFQINLGHILQNDLQLGVATLQTSPRYEEHVHYF